MFDHVKATPLLLIAAAITIGLSACAPAAPPAPTEAAHHGTPSDVADEGSDDDDRAFDSTDDAVIAAIEAALSSKHAKAQWQGSTVRITLDGSAADPTAWLWCSAAEAVIAETEDAVLVYSDGEAVCNDRPGGRP